MSCLYSVSQFVLGNKKHSLYNLGGAIELVVANSDIYQPLKLRYSRALLFELFGVRLPVVVLLSFLALFSWQNHIMMSELSFVIVIEAP